MNHCDCGSYLLHFVELFLKKAPQYFSLAASEGFPYFVSGLYCSESFLVVLPLKQVSEIWKPNKSARLSLPRTIDIFAAFGYKMTIGLALFRCFTLLCWMFPGGLTEWNFFFFLNVSAYKKLV